MLQQRSARHIVPAILLALVGLCSVLPTIGQLNGSEAPYFQRQGPFGFATDGTRITAVATPPGAVTLVRQGAQVGGPQKAPPYPAFAAGLKVGDRLVVPLPLMDRLVQYKSQPPGAMLLLTIIRSGREQEVTLVTPAAWVPDALTSALIIARVIAYLLFVIVGVGLVLLKPTRMTWAFCVYCVGAAAPHGFIGVYFNFLPTVWWWILKSSWEAFYLAATFGFLVFVMRFPDDVVEPRFRGLDKAAPWLGLVYGLLAASWWIGTTLQVRGLDWLQDLVLGLPVVILIIAAFLLLLRLWGSSGDQKVRFVYVLGVVCLADTLLIGTLFINYSNNSSLLYSRYGDLASRVLALATVIVPITIALAVTRNKLFDVRLVLKRTAVIAIVSISVILVFSSIEAAIDKLFADQKNALSTVLALTLGAWLKPFNDRVDQWLTHLLNKGNLCGRIQQSVRDLLDLKNSEDFAEYRKLLASELGARQAFVLEMNGNDEVNAEGMDPQIAQLRQNVLFQNRIRARELIDNLRAFVENEAPNLEGVLALPILCLGSVSWALVVGPKSDGEEYTSDELTELQRFTAVLGPVMCAIVRSASPQVGIGANSDPGIEAHLSS